MDNEELVINDLKRIILNTSAKSGEGHVASAFSILDILWVLYKKIIKVNPLDPYWSERDIFILSKGHASLGLYAILAYKGFFSISELDKFCTLDSFLGGHPDCNKVPGVEASTGSLGHGLPFALGIAFSKKIQKKISDVYVILGDGECNEGTIWESALIASNHKLDNLKCIIDYNHSNDRALKLGDLKAKFMSFGWESYVIDGHNHEQIYQFLLKKSNGKPLAIIAETIKGKGIKQMESNPAWHHKSPNKEELEIMLNELL